VKASKPYMNRDLFPGALEMMILQSLRRSPLHGYALAQLIKNESDELLQVEEGSLYPALQRMLKSGWVEAEWGLSERNRKVRIYRITKAGRHQLANELTAYQRMIEGITKVMRLRAS
jgi:PadR family transcriptional regulator, regulatory protein PadR